MKKLVLTACIIMCMTMLFGCSSGAETSAQSRTDLTGEHIRGLSVDMKRKDVEDLIGQDDDSLAQKEDIDIYSLSDGSTAVLRYVDDALVGVSIRGKDMYEESIFNKFARDIEDGLDGTDGNYNTEDGKVNGETNESGLGESQDASNGANDNNTGDTGNGTDMGTGNTNSTSGANGTDTTGNGTMGGNGNTNTSDTNESETR